MEYLCIGTIICFMGKCFTITYQQKQIITHNDPNVNVSEPKQVSHPAKVTGAHVDGVDHSELKLFTAFQQPSKIM